MARDRLTCGSRYQKPRAQFMRKVHPAAPPERPFHTACTWEFTEL